MAENKTADGSYALHAQLSAPFLCLSSSLSLSLPCSLALASLVRVCFSLSRVLFLRYFCAHLADLLEAVEVELTYEALEPRMPKVLGEDVLLEASRVLDLEGCAV